MMMLDWRYHKSSDLRPQSSTPGGAKTWRKPAVEVFAHAPDLGVVLQ